MIVSNRKSQTINATDVQKGIAFYSQFSESFSVYVTQVEVVYKQNFYLPNLKKAWDLLSQESFLLKACYQNGEFIAGNEFNITIDFHDFSKNTNSDHLYQNLKESDLSKSIQLEKPPLYRVIVAKIADNDSRLIWSHHHILFDASSFTKIISRLFEIYKNLENGKGYQKHHFDHNIEINTQINKEYWKKLLNNFCGNNIGNLPISSQLGNYKPYHIKFNISEKIKNNISTICINNNFTLNAFLQLCWGMIIAKYTGKNDVVFGTVRAYPRALTNGKAGLFINTLPVRVIYNTKNNIFDLIKHVRAQHEKIRDYVGHSLQEIHTLIDLPSEYALFDTVVDFKQNAVGKLFKSNLSDSSISMDFIVNTNYPLLVELTEEDYEINIKVTYNQSVFDNKFVNDLFSSYLMLIGEVCEKGNCRLNELNYLSAEQKYQIMYAFNSTKYKLDNEKYLYEAFENSAKQYANKLGVISSRGSLSYDEINVKANQVAHKLRELGSKPNELVAIVMEKGWEEVVATLGIMKSGSAYLPIDAGFPNQRIQQLLKQGKVRFVLTQSNYLRMVTWPADVEAFALDNETIWNNYAGSNLIPVQKLSDLAYVIFTSGSTGTPKGVMINHLGAMNTIADINTRFNVAAHDIILGLSALNFDLSVYDIFGVLGSGATLVLPAEEDRKDPSVWLRLVCEYKITLWNSVPALMQMLVEYGLSEKAAKELQSIRLVLLSGDWIPLDLPGNVQELCGSDTQIISLGGATEGSIWSILYPIKLVETCWRSIPYGRPMWNQQFYILDENQQLQPAGILGELCIGGVGVAKGYWDNHEQTAKSFIHHPELGYLYRTGDLGCYQENGVIEFLGRVDQQVKIRGYRIELGEIETAILGFPSIKNVIVIADSDENKSSKKLVAYFTGAVDLEVEKIKNYLYEKLPGYMVPEAFISLDAMPLSANGKVNIRALPKVNFEKSKNNIYCEPVTEVELMLSKVWGKLLRIKNISLNDNFFELGGNSLSFTQMFIEIKKQFAIEFPLRIIFQLRNLKELSSYIEGLVLKDTKEEPGELWYI